MAEDKMDQPPFQELAAELRELVGSEFRAEAEEVERLTELGTLRRRSFGDLAAELMARGDKVVASVGSRSFTGTIIYVATSLAILDTGHGEVDLYLDGPVILRLAERSLEGGVGTGSGAPGFRARLMEFEQTGERLEVIVPSAGESLIGAVKVVAPDHVVIGAPDGQEWYVPLGAIGAVARTGPR